MAIEAYPLCWPQGWKRFAPSDRTFGRFNRKETKSRQWGDGSVHSYTESKTLSVSDGVSRILEALERMGVDRQDVIVSTNVRTRLDGMPRSGEREPDDPGAAVYWLESRNANQPPRCIAIDRYTKVADNLAAIAATFEAMRAIERHGGAEILERAFTGFTGLPASTAGEAWWDVLGVSAHASEAEINDAYRRLARAAHPDNKETGSDDAIRRLNVARDQAMSVVKGRA